MKRWSGRLLATLLLLLSVGGAAHADLITPWTYSWSRSPLSVAADNLGTGGISLTLVPMTGTNMTGDNPNITAVNLSTFSSAPAGTIDTFTSAPYSLSIHLTDLNSNQSGDLTFTGVFNGTLNPTSAQITTTYQSPLTQNITLGQHQYSVALSSFKAPGKPDSTVPGFIDASVLISNISTSTGGDTGTGNGGGVQTVPEPSTLMLAGLAVPAGLAWWRARGWRRREETAND